jgi:hypothetical protein
MSFEITPQFLAESALRCADAGERIAGREGLDFTSLVTVGFLAGRVAKDGVKAVDSAVLDAYRQAATAGAVAPVRKVADATEYYEHDLTAPLRDQPFVRPQRPRALLAAIPTIAIDPGQRYYTIRYLDHLANAAKMRGGDTSPPIAGIARTELPPREVHWTWSAAPTAQWFSRRQDAYAGHDNEAERRAAAVLGVEQAMNQDLLATDAGVALWGLAPGPNAVPALREASPLASVLAATGDQMLADFDEALSKIAEVSDTTMPAPDSMLVDLPLLNLMRRKFNFVAGGEGSIVSAFQAVMASHGITSVSVCNELRNFAGAGTGAIVLFSRGSDLSLRHALAMRPAPVHSYTGPTGDLTIYAGASAGLVVPNAQAAYIRSYRL